MTILNISLCLPELDIAALAHTHSIVAVTERFMIPNKSFVLLPCRDQTSTAPYHKHIQKKLNPLTSPPDETIAATHWAQCILSQQMSDEASIKEIAPRTIWTHQTLIKHLRTRKNLFLSLLRVYVLSEAISIKTAPICEQLYRFSPLQNIIEGDVKSPVLNEEAFNRSKQAFLNPIESIEPDPTSTDILQSSNWVEKIAEVGNSSDGHTFEKLIRKGLIELGFQNTLNKIEASLDPEATGGAGGLDFYANKPYSIVGECKATSTNKVQDPSTQLHKLGLKYLSKQVFEDSIKLILAAGKLTTHANKIANGHQLNVIRPETFQTLIELKLNYENAVDLGDLKAYLQMPPFGMEANEKVRDIINQWETEIKQKVQYIQKRHHIIQTVCELAEQPIHKGQNAFKAIEIRAHYNAKHQPLITDNIAKAMLLELSSPLAGYLGRKQLPGDQERFYFVKQLLD